MFSVLVDPVRLAGVDWMRREIDGFVGYVKGSPPTDPGSPVCWCRADPERLSRRGAAARGHPAWTRPQWEELGDPLGRGDWGWRAAQEPRRSPHPVAD